MIHILAGFVSGTLVGLALALAIQRRADRRDDDTVEAVARQPFGTDGGPR